MVTKAKRSDDGRDLNAAAGVPASAGEPGYNERVFELVRRIPAGQVMTYGQLAEILGEGYTARTVGFAMHAADESVPWHRVINAQGACSTARMLLPLNKQQRMLEAEGIEFDARDRCDLRRYRWTPEEARADDIAQDDEGAQPSLFGN
ncbi:MAG TPA: MGMT family protein [Pyrinomonadaceae bacterium]|jgi:methylated-DNA-protein-cysteine methyltransferase-like protein|nr:MGMT family protein [Pyrinomonadaceae bacterium]